MPITRFFREAADSVARLRHGIEWIGYYNEDRVRRMLHNLLDDGLDDVIVRSQQSRSRLIPGLRGNPAVITTMSLLAVSR